MLQEVGGRDGKGQLQREEEEDDDASTPSAKNDEKNDTTNPPDPPDFMTSETSNSQGSPALRWKRRRFIEILCYTPRRCRYDPSNPPPFSMALNLLFGFAATFTVANLYYNHPILNILAEDFDVSNERASLVPTLAQAGYACGLIFLCPLGDNLPRRPFVLWLVLFTGLAW